MSLPVPLRLGFNVSISHLGQMSVDLKTFKSYYVLPCCSKRDKNYRICNNVRINTQIYLFIMQKTNVPFTANRDTTSDAWKKRHEIV